MEHATISPQGPAAQSDPVFPGSTGDNIEHYGFHQAVVGFKRALIESTLRQTEGNRTRAAKCLGLQRTYLLRLMRDLSIQAPPPRRNGRRVLAPVQESREPKRD